MGPFLDIKHAEIWMADWLIRILLTHTVLHLSREQRCAGAQREQDAEARQPTKRNRRAKHEAGGTEELLIFFSHRD
jgi:hypothetical protein